MKPTKVLLVCPECGSPEIWGETTYQLNSGELGEVRMGSDSITCAACGASFGDAVEVAVASAPVTVPTARTT